MDRLVLSLFLLLKMERALFWPWDLAPSESGRRGALDAPANRYILICGNSVRFVCVRAFRARLPVAHGHVGEFVYRHIKYMPSPISDRGRS